MTARQHFRNALWLTSSGAIAKILLLVASVLTYKHLSVLENGILGFALAYGSICALFMEAGLRGYTMRELSRMREHHDSAARLFTLTLNTRAAVLLLTGPVALVIVWMLGYRGPVLAFVVAMIGYGLLDSLGMYFKAVLRCYDRMAYDAVFSISAKLLLLLVLAGAVYTRHLTLPIVSVAYVGSAALEVGSLALVVGKSLRLPFLAACTPRAMYQLLRTSLPFASIIMIAMLYLRTGVFTLSALPWLQPIFSHFELLAEQAPKISSIVAIAFFTTAARLPEALSFLPLGVVNAMIPHLSRSKGQTAAVQTIFTILIKYLGIAGFMLGAWLATQPASFLLLVSKHEYLPATAAFSWLAIALPFSFLRYTTSNLLICLDQERVLIRREVIALILNLVLNIALVPNWTFLGAAVALAISEAVSFFLELAILKTRCGVQLPARLWLLWAGAAAAVAVPSMLVGGLAPLPSLVPGAIAAILCLAVIVLSNPGEVRALMRRQVAEIAEG
ncbi:MAG: polysaccharide biosynthesis C-terminal domain-containing protein [Candidatus Sumerlaeaceae bacterium]